MTRRVILSSALKLRHGIVKEFPGKDESKAVI